MGRAGVEPAMFTSGVTGLQPASFSHLDTDPDWKGKKIGMRLHVECRTWGTMELGR